MYWKSVIYCVFKFVENLMYILYINVQESMAKEWNPLFHNKKKNIYMVYGGRKKIKFYRDKLKKVV